MTFLLELAVGDVRLGGKARSLADLAAQGLPTPPGFVVSDDVIRALCPDLPLLQRLDQDAVAQLDQARAQLADRPWPKGFSAELHHRLEMLAVHRFAVRSSFVSEDRPGHLAAGVYESQLDVATEAVERAIREVLASALSPGAVAYALAHGQNPTAGPLAVLVHAYVAGIAEGSAALGAGPAAEPLLTVRHGELGTADRHAIGETLGRLRAVTGPVEVEWVHAGDRLIYLQARPFEPPRPAAAWAGWTELGQAEDAAAWRWDTSHNPLPLSPAQQGLVELVDGKCSIGVRQRVLGGYLFYRKDERPLPPGIPSEAAGTFCASLRAQIDAGLAELRDPPDLAAVLALFVSVYEPIFGILQPALREAHRRLRELIARHAPAALALLPALRTAVPSLASERLRLAQQLAMAESPAGRQRALREYLRLFGDEAPLWDVMAPTYGEAPDTVLVHLPSSLPPPAQDWQQASAQVEGMLAPSLHDEWRSLLALSRTAVALGEEDDWLYARAQAAVRRALLVVGRRLVAARALSEAEEVCYLPLDLVRGMAAGVAPPLDLASMAAAGRQAWQVALANPPPSPTAPERALVRGAGTGGRAIGRVAMHRPGMPRPQRPDTVLVARTLLPTELPLLSAVALVCETGGVLDHVAAQARERGIPAVVSAHGATEALAEGDLVLVDGERGLVVRMASSR